ncbi:MAG TPA: DNA/RNA non-specific endonuclease, partial [Opitutales bacterium]|nr:DNA/RNA non-specific endonuclease [Opitutales bacterium]
NIIPQRPDLNRKIWKAIEKREINRYAPRFNEVWVITGPVYSSVDHPQRLPSLVAIPSHCYKILMHNSDYGVRTMAFIIPQTGSADGALKPFLVSIDEIEARTGLDFFANLPPETQIALEAQPAARLW